jgi:hypothetical protein
VASARQPRWNESASGSAGQSAGATQAGRVVLVGRRVKVRQVPGARLCPMFWHSRGYFDRCARMGGGSAGGRCGGARKALDLRGTLRGRMVLGGADSGWPGLVCASVFAGQGVYLGRGDRSVGHGKEQLCGRLPSRARRIPGEVRRVGNVAAGRESTGVVCGTADPGRALTLGVFLCRTRLGLPAGSRRRVAVLHCWTELALIGSRLRGDKRLI